MFILKFFHILEFIKYHKMLYYIIHIIIILIELIFQYIQKEGNNIKYINGKVGFMVEVVGYGGGGRGS